MDSTDRISGAAGHDDVLRAEARDREIKRRYEDEATVLNMSRKDLTAKVILTDEIPRLRSLTAMEGVHPDFHLLKWRELSGVQHGEMGAMNLLSDTNYPRSFMTAPIGGCRRRWCRCWSDSCRRVRQDAA